MTGTEGICPTHLSAIRPLAENARAIRAAVTLMLAGRPCGCGSPDWHVDNVSGGIRHVVCRCCGRTAKIGPDTVRRFAERAAGSETA